MWGCMRYLSILPAVDDTQLSPCVEMQQLAPTGKQRIVPLTGTDSKTYYSYPEFCTAKTIFIFLSVQKKVLFDISLNRPYSYAQA